MVKGWFLMNFVFAEGSSLSLLQTRTVAFLWSFLLLTRILEIVTFWPALAGACNATLCGPWRGTRRAAGRCAAACGGERAADAGRGMRRDCLRRARWASDGRLLPGSRQQRRAPSAGTSSCASSGTATSPSPSTSTRASTSSGWPWCSRPGCSTATAARRRRGRQLSARRRASGSGRGALTAGRGP